MTILSGLLLQEHHPIFCVYITSTSSSQGSLLHATRCSMTEKNAWATELAERLRNETCDPGLLPVVGSTCIGPNDLLYNIYIYRIDGAS